LDQRGGTAEVAFLIGVEDSDERNLRQVEAFTEQVDADEDIEFAAAEVAQDFDAFGFEFHKARIEFGEFLKSAGVVFDVVFRRRGERSGHGGGGQQRGCGCGLLHAYDCSARRTTGLNVLEIMFWK